MTEGTQVTLSRLPGRDRDYLHACTASYIYGGYDLLIAHRWIALDEENGRWAAGERSLDAHWEVIASELCSIQREDSVRKHLENNRLTILRAV